MGKKKIYELDDEFFVQLDFLRADFDEALQTIEEQKKDIFRLTALLVENGISIPGDLMERYIKRDPDPGEDLPFN